MEVDLENSQNTQLRMDESSNNSGDTQSQISRNGGGSDTSESRQNVSRKSTGSVQNMGRDTYKESPDDDDEVQICGVNNGGGYRVKTVPTEDLKFMQNFDPQCRNQLKKKKRYHHNDGRLIQYAHDFEECDCLRPNCEGCHLPCKNCGDHRCGHECRTNRKWVYESLEIEGRPEIEFRNPNYSAFT